MRESTWREFDTLNGVDPRIKVGEFQKLKAIQIMAENTIKMRELLQNLVYAQQRMLERWADGDENVKNTLWQNLHNAGNAAQEYLILLNDNYPDGKQ